MKPVIQQNGQACSSARRDGMGKQKYRHRKALQRRSKKQTKIGYYHFLHTELKPFLHLCLTIPLIPPLETIPTCPFYEY